MFGIVAINNRNVIGRNGELPWHCPEDLKWFKMKTDGGTLIVGRKTADRLPPLPNRHIVCVSRQTGVGIKSVLERVPDFKSPVFVAGGASIYDQFMPYITTFFVTRINDNTNSDTFMPDSFRQEFEFVKHECDFSDGSYVSRYVRKITYNQFDMSRKIETWDQYGMGLAFYVAMKSKDESSKVGAVILHPHDNIPRGIGFNGMPVGVNDAVRERYERPLKYSYFEHAERNAIYNSVERLNGCTIYVTSIPCPDCARAIIQKRIARVVVHPSYRMMSNPSRDASWEVSKEMFKESRVNFCEYNGPPIPTRIIAFGGEKVFCPNNWRLL